MASISSPGIGSGLDINSILTQLVAIERQPIVALEKQATTLQTRLSTYGKVQSSLAALRDAAQALTRAQTWSTTVAASRDPTVVAVGGGTAGVPAVHVVKVTKLATSQTNATATYASPEALVGEGTLHLDIGSWNAGQSAFTAKSGSSTVDIAIGPPAQTLAQVRDKINLAGAGVTASVLTDASGSRLVLRSSMSGVENGFRVGVTESGTAGLAALAFDPAVGILTMAQAMGAANAAVSLNNLPIGSASNTLTNVVDGLTLSVGKESATPVQITVRQDDAALRKAVDTFVTAYNDLNKLLAEETRFNGIGKAASPLQGDSAALSIRNQMRNMLGVSSGASSQYARLSDIGLEIQRDGSIKVDESKIAGAIANAGELKKLFGNMDALEPANDGIATQLRKLADSLLGTGGTVASRSDGLRRQIDLNQDRQALLAQRVAQTEKRLRAQYTALDRQMGQLNGLSNYVTQQINAFNRSNGNF